MLFSRLPALCGRAFLLLLVAQLYACGSGGQNARATSPASNVDDHPGNTDVSVSEPDIYQLSVDMPDGGYVLDTDVDLLCSEQFSMCSTEVAASTVKTLRATSRFGYVFSGWNISDDPTQVLDIAVIENTAVSASFEAVPQASDMAADYKNWSCDQDTAADFRVLHLGDSLTLGPIPGKKFNVFMPEPVSISFYEQSAGKRVLEPMILAMHGFLTIGPGNGNTGQAFSENNYWKQAAEKRQAEIDDFDGVVVALGSNDITQIINDGLDPDFIVEQRIKPLLQWLGERPVYWILPHYGRWPTAMQNIQFKGTADGLDCSCDSSGNHPSTQCHILDEMQSCAIDESQQKQTIEAFRAIHALRARLAALQDEYANLIVVDPVQTVAAASNGGYDLYATLTPSIDTIHFSLQGAEWYAWLHAWLALHVDTNCNMPPLSKWQMGNAELAMAAQLDSAP
jgi:hypothetical protein